MFSVGRLISNTPEERITKARNTQGVNVLNVLGGGVQFQDSKSLEDFDKKAESTLVLEVKSDTGHPHKVALNFPKGLGKDMPVKCFCDCADFKYRLAYVMWRAGSYYGKPPEGIKDFPEKTNPNAIPYMCKHLSAAVMSLSEEGMLKL